LLTIINGGGCREWGCDAACLAADVQGGEVDQAFELMDMRADGLVKAALVPGAEDR
jgi:hypothetical protein